MTVRSITRLLMEHYWETRVQTQIIRRKRLSDEVLARLEEMLLSPQYKPGDQIPSERQLMERFGVGRPTIREALYSLQKMGLLEIKAGERGRVTKPTPRLLLNELRGAARHLLAEPEGERHFQVARTFFEVGLVRHAAQHASPTDIEDLRAALDANKAALGDLDAFERTDVAFHLVLAEISRNPIFSAIHEAVAEWLTMQRSLTLRIPNAGKMAYRSHECIFDAVAEKNPERAESVMRDHLETVARQYWQARGQMP